MPNSVALVLAIIIAAAGYFGGHHVGENDQKVADQTKFDSINEDLRKQKEEAAGILATKNAENLALMVERDTFKTNLEKQHVANQKVIDDLRVKYAGYGLRFKPTQDGLSRQGGGSSGSTPAGTASNVGAQELQLPGVVTANLRQLAYSCDELNIDYRKCVDYARKVTCN